MLSFLFELEAGPSEKNELLWKEMVFFLEFASELEGWLGSESGLLLIVCLGWLEMGFCERVVNGRAEGSTVLKRGWLEE